MNADAMKYFAVGDEATYGTVPEPERGVRDLLEESLPLDELARDSQAGGARRRRRQSRKRKGKGRRSTRRPKRLQRRHRR
jgi:hypothetical protein